MRNSILIMMSLSGSVVLIFYILLYPLAKKYFAIRWRYNILKTALLFFLFPIPHYKYRIQKIVNLFIPFFNDKMPATNRYYFSNLIIRFEKELYVSNNIKRKIIYLAFAGVVTFVIIGMQLYQYYKLRKILKIIGSTYSIKQSECMGGYIEKTKKLCGIREKITVIFSPYIEMPSVIGIFKPVIYMPESFINRFSPQDLQMILIHEMIHIKHKDLLFKFISLFTMAVHWFNPLCYLLFFEICNISEVYCDEAVIQKMGQNITKKYGNLLIDISEGHKTHIQDRFFSGMINSGGVILKKRIIEMKTERKRTLKKVSLFMGMLICLGSTSTALAYTPHFQIDMLDDQSFESANLDSAQWIEFNEGDKNPYITVEHIPYDTFFRDENGNVFEIGNESSKEKRSCSHEYIPGTVITHVHIGEGCRIDVYNASRCNRCGKVIRKEHLSTIYNDICLH